MVPSLAQSPSCILGYNHQQFLPDYSSNSTRLHHSLGILERHLGKYAFHLQGLLSNSKMVFGPTNPGNWHHRRDRNFSVFGSPMGAVCLTISVKLDSLPSKHGGQHTHHHHSMGKEHLVSHSVNSVSDPPSDKLGKKRLVILAV